MIKQSDLKLPFGTETQKPSYFRTHAKTTKNNEIQTFFLIPQGSDRLLESNMYNKLQNIFIQKFLRPTGENIFASDSHSSPIGKVSLKVEINTSH